MNAVISHHLFHFIYQTLYHFLKTDFLSPQNLLEHFFFFAINESIIHAFKEQENTSTGDKFQRIFIISFSGNVYLSEYSHEINIYDYIDLKMVVDF